MQYLLYSSSFVIFGIAIMSMPVIQTDFELTDFHVVKNVESCSCPAITYYIYDKSMYDYLPGAAERGQLDYFTVHIPGLKIDEFTEMLVQLDKLLCKKIFPEYGQSVTDRFFEEFIEQFYPQKEYEFVVKFGKDVCIIDNVQNDGESSAEFALSERQTAFAKKTVKQKKVEQTFIRAKELKYVGERELECAENGKIYDFDSPEEFYSALVKPIVDSDEESIQMYAQYNSRIGVTIGSPTLDEFIKCFSISDKENLPKPYFDIFYLEDGCPDRRLDLLIKKKKA